MFYRIKDNRVYDYADYEYAKDCLYIDSCTLQSYEANRENYIIDKGELKEVQVTEEEIEQKRKTEFEAEFFQTSLGWIRRKVTMKDGSIRDFLADLLLPIKAGMELGNSVEIITYSQPDFSIEPTQEYIISLQERKYATPEFIQECLMQTVSDFGFEGGIEEDGI